MSVKVFIDGSSGTTGLRIADRLAQRPEIELLSISAEGRKDVNERAKVINSADLAFLCLPDAASKEVMPLLRPDVKVLDTSTAFRTDAAWDYGFPELAGQKEKIKNSCRVAVPGCYASGFISIARPLVELGLAPADYPFSCTGISGYSGGGKKMIAEYESADRPAHSKLDAPKSYGLGLAHKHLPEMQKISGLAHTPMFVPVVCDYYCGMQVLVPLDLTLAGSTAEQVAEGILEALDKLGSSKPLVVRFDGNAAAEGLSILARADRANLHVAQTMEEAAQQAAHLAANGREVR